MLKSAYDAILDRLDKVIPVVEAAAPSIALEGIERLLGKVEIYQKIPSMKIDDDGYRLLEDPRNGSYKGRELVTGITELSLRETDRDRNAKGVLLAYIDDSTIVGDAKEMSKLAICTLLETGAVVSSYIDSDKNRLVYAWFHPSRPHNGLWGYPQSERIILRDLLKTARVAGLLIDENCRTFDVLPTLVMLAAEAYSKIKVMN